MSIDPINAFRLDDRVAIVTGASSGLGERFARVLHDAGASVILVARRADRVDALAGELERSVGVTADVTDPDAPSAIVHAAIERFGRLDVVVNNAGTAKVTEATEEATGAFRGVVEVNLVAPFAMSREAARVMIPAGGGSIVNISSIWGVVGVGRIPNASYAASKAGLVGLTRELAAQWAPHGVRVNALAPGWFESEMTSGTMFGNERAERWMHGRTPMARGGAPHELDGALLFLASDASTFVTGALLPVDGGWTAI